MKTFFKILIFLLIGFYAKGQTKLPSGLPSPYSTNYYRIGWMKTDSGSVFANRDTTMRPLWPGTSVFWLNPGVDSTIWLWDSYHWKKLGVGGTSGTFQSPIQFQNQNVNTGTPGQATTYDFIGTGVTASVVGNVATISIAGPVSAHGIISLNGDTTSNALLVPGSAGTSFNIKTALGVTTFNIPLANGLDTGLVTPNLYTTWNLKQNALTFGNPSTSTLSITGNYNNSVIGSGFAVNLAPIGSAGTCTNCDLSLDAFGRVTAFSNGTGGGGSDTAFAVTFPLTISRTGNLITFGVSPIQDTTFVKNEGASGLGLLYVLGTDTIAAKKIVGGTGINLVQNADSSITINGTGSLDSAIWKSSGTYTASQTLTMGAYTQAVNGSQSTTMWDITNSGTGGAIIGNASSGQAVTGLSTSGQGGFFSSNTGLGAIIDIDPTSTNLSLEALRIRHTISGGGTAQIGLGTRISIHGATNPNGDEEMAVVEGVYTNIGSSTRTSTLNLYNYNNGSIQTGLSILGTGQIQFPQYPGSFTGTAVYNLLVDASGNVIIGSVPVGGVQQAYNGLYLSSTGDSIGFGGTITKNDTLSSTAYGVVMIDSTAGVATLKVMNKLGTSLQVTGASTTTANVLTVTNNGTQSAILAGNFNGSSNTAVITVNQSGTSVAPGIIINTVGVGLNAISTAVNNGNNSPAVLAQSLGGATTALKALVQDTALAAVDVVSTFVRSIGSGVSNPTVGMGVESDIFLSSVSSHLSGIDVAKFKTISTNVTDATYGVDYHIGLINVGSFPANDQFIVHSSGQLTLSQYLLTTSFSGTPVGALGFDASGNILTLPGGGSVTNVIDTTIAGIRAFTTASASILYYTKDLGQQGFWYYVSTDVSSTDNTGTILVDASGHRYYRQFSGPVSVQWFGAKGNGTNDDATAIQNTVTYAANNGYDLKFPYGNYALKSFPNGTGNASIISFPAFYSGRHTMNIFADEGTIITTSLDSNTSANDGSEVFNITGAYVDCQIYNIFFQNTHSFTSYQTDAIGLYGTAGNLNNNFIIHDCKFEGFSQAIVSVGTNGLKIHHNRFGAPLGRDNGTGSSGTPSPFIWLFTNSGGYTINPDIHDNLFDGFTGTGSITATTSRAMMDNAVYGTYFGGDIHNNILKHLGTESISQGYYNSQTYNTFQTVIENNSIDQTIPVGTYGAGTSSLLTNNVAIRSQGVNPVIQYNHIHNATTAIENYNQGQLNYPYSHLQINQNTIDAVDSAQGVFTTAIIVSGYGSGTVNHVPEISGNTVNFKNDSLKANAHVYEIDYTDSAYLHGNTTMIYNLTFQSYTLNWLQQQGSVSTYLSKNQTIPNNTGVYANLYVNSGGSSYINLDSIPATQALTMNNSGSGASSGSTFNGATPVTLSYNTIGAQQALTLTTTGTSGAATLSGGTLNIPQYAGTSGWGLSGNSALSTNFIGTTGNTSFPIYTNNTFAMVVDSTQAVGIGAYPNKDFGSGYYNHQFSIINDSTQYQTMSMWAFGTPSGLTGQNDDHDFRARGRYGAPAAVQSGDYFYSKGLRAYDGTAWSSSSGAFQGLVSENWNSTSHGTQWDFQTTTNGTTVRHETFHLNNDGAVWVTQASTLSPLTNGAPFYRTTGNFVVDMQNNPSALSTGIFIPHNHTNIANILFGDSLSNSEAYLDHFGLSESGNLVGSVVNARTFFINSVGATAMSGSQVVLYPGSGSLGGIDVTATGVYIGTQTALGTVTPTAYLQLAAGTSSVPQLVLNSSTLVSTTVAGAIENNGTHLYYTATGSGTRYQLDQQGPVGGDQAIGYDSSGAWSGNNAAFYYQYANHAAWIKNTAASGVAEFVVYNGTYYGEFGVTGSSGSVTGFIGANSVYNYNSVPTVDMMIDNASGLYKIGIGSGIATPQWTFSNTGDLMMGTTTDNGSTLQVKGSVSTNYVAKTADYTATASDFTIDVTTGGDTITLPTAASITGRIYIITNSSSGTVSVRTTSSQTFTNVSGTPTIIVMATPGSTKVQSTGSNWVVLSINKWLLLLLLNALMGSIIFKRKSFHQNIL